MIINHQYKFIFIKTRKTAGTSIEIALSDLCGRSDVITPLCPEEDDRKRREMGIRGAQNYLVPLRFHKPKSWPRRLIMGGRKRFYNHWPASLIKKNVNPSIWNEYFKFCFERNPFDKVISRYFWDKHHRNIDCELNDYIMNVSDEFLSDWNIYAIEDEVAVDCVGHYENLAGDLAAIAEKLKLPRPIELPRAKAAFRSNRRHYSEVLDARSRARIERVCANELEAFDYRWQPSERRRQVSR